MLEEKEKEYFASYSAEHIRMYGGSLYTNANGEEVLVSCVSEEEEYVKAPHFNWSDTVVLPFKVYRWVRSVRGEVEMSFVKEPADGLRNKIKQIASGKRQL